MRKEEFDNVGEFEALGVQKTRERKEYDTALEKRKKYKALVDSRKTTKRGIVAKAIKMPRESKKFTIFCKHVLKLKRFRRRRNSHDQQLDNLP